MCQDLSVIVPKCLLKENSAFLYGLKGSGYNYETRFYS